MVNKITFLMQSSCFMDRSFFSSETEKSKSNFYGKLLFLMQEEMEFVKWSTFEMIYGSLAFMAATQTTQAAHHHKLATPPQCVAAGFTNKAAFFYACR